MIDTLKLLGEVILTSSTSKQNIGCSCSFVTTDGTLLQSLILLFTLCEPYLGSCVIFELFRISINNRRNKTVND